MGVPVLSLAGVMGEGGEQVNAARDGVIDFVAGAIGATVSVYVGQPLDTVKVKMQTFPHLYPNLVDCTKQTLLKDGLARGLYAGTVPSLAANIGENSVLFAAYGGCQKLVASATGVEKTENLGMFANGVSGFLAAFWSSLVLCPTELVKCRLQAMRESEALAGRPPPKIGPGKLTGEMPGYFFFFMAYEATRHVLTPAGKTKDEIGALRTVVAGGVAGVTLWTIIFPADVVKSRLQVSGASTPMLAVMGDILKKEGLARLYSGLGPTLLRTFPATGALFLAYE